MDGGAQENGYAARIAAALKQLEESGSLARGRAAEMADEVVARLSAEDPPQDSEALEDSDLLVLDEEYFEDDAASPDDMLEKLPRFSSGLGRAPERAIQADHEDDLELDDDDVADVGTPPEDSYEREVDRYSTADVAYDYDDAELQADDEGFFSEHGDTELEFHGNPSQLISLVLKNTVLTILTLGMYRFWAQRDMRQFLWQAVYFQGEHPEYQGRAIDGFLAFVAVTLFTVASAGLLILLPQLFVPHRPITAALELFYFVGLFLMFQGWCQWRRRYNLDHTAWHGIRFERSPQSVQRAIPLIGIWCLVLLTAGLAYPLARVISARDLFKDVRFGPASVIIEANAQPLLLPWAIVYGVLAATFVLVGTDWIFDSRGATGGAILLYWMASMLMIIASFGALVWYKCGEFDYFVSSLFVGQSRAYTDLPAFQLLLKAALPVFGFLIFSLSLFLLAYFSFDAFLQLTAEEAPANIQVNGTFIALGFAATLIGGFIYQVLLNIFRLDVLKAIAEKGSID